MTVNFKDTLMVHMTLYCDGSHYEIERGDSACSVRNLRLIAKSISVSTDYLINGEGIMDCDCPELNKEIKNLNYGQKKKIAGVIRAFYGGIQ